MQTLSIGAHASDNAKAHANLNAKGIWGTTVDGTADTDVSAETDGTQTETSTDTDVEGSTDTVTPVEPRVAAKDASTVKGNQTGKQIEAWAHTKGEVEVAAPDAVSLDVRANASVKLDD